MLEGLRGRVATAGQAVHGIAHSAKDKARQRLQQAQEKMSQQGDYTELRSTLQSFMADRAHVDVDALRQAGFGIRDRVGAEWYKHKQEAERKLFDMAGPVRDAVLLALRESVKQGLTADPDMCRCIKTRMEELVDLFWDDLLQTISKTMEDAKQQALGQQTKDIDTLAEVGQPPCLLGPRWWRAKLLYHLLPFDLSIFGNFKDPMWWVLTFLMCMPNFSFLPEPWNCIPIRVPFFTVYLICVVTGCPADEFQLVQFIMAIKGLQFVCSGVLMMCIAAYMYFMCVHPGGKHTCDQSGPGAKQPLFVSLTDWLGTCILVWVAFLWLPCSSRSAGSRDEFELEAEEGDVREAREVTATCCGGVRDSDKGGRLRRWLGYDLVCFVGSVIVCYIIMCVDLGHLRPGDDDKSGFPEMQTIVGESIKEAERWTGHAAVFWARIWYALLSLPFLIFWIPGLQGILTHTRLTGYNKNGACVPYMLHPVPKEEKDGEKTSKRNSNTDTTTNTNTNTP